MLKQRSASNVTAKVRKFLLFIAYSMIIFKSCAHCHSSSLLLCTIISKVAYTGRNFAHFHLYNMSLCVKSNRAFKDHNRSLGPHMARKCLVKCKHYSLLLVKFNILVHGNTKYHIFCSFNTKWNYCFNEWQKRAWLKLKHIGASQAHG